MKHTEIGDLEQWGHVLLLFNWMPLDKLLDHWTWFVCFYEMLIILILQGCYED